MKMLECKRARRYDVGFIDPYTVNDYSVQRHAKDTKDNLVSALRRHTHKREILFPYNFK